MKRPRPHEIDEAAGRIFINALPLGWTHNDHKHDYGKDYLVEVGKNQEMTGLSCFIQQKGQDKVVMRSKRGIVQFSLERKHATYYLDKVTDLPVFLVLVDVTTKCGWWLFLQPYLRSDQSWRKRQTALIRIPLSNRLDDTNAFTDAIEQANKTMRGMHPTAIQDAIAFTTDEVKRLDPRFDVSVNVKDGKITNILNAKEPVTLKFTIQAETIDDVNNKWDAFERGRAITFKPGELIFEGSPLFDRAATDGGTFQARMKAPFALSVSTIGKDGHELATISDISGKLVGGRKEAVFNGSIGEKLMTVCIGPYGDIPNGTKRSFKFNCSLYKWEGRPVSKLQWFDKIAPFLASIDKAEKVKLVYCRDGNFVMEETFPIEGMIPAGISPYFEGIKRARAVCKYLGVDPTWTLKAYGKTITGDINQLYDLCVHGRHETAVLKYGATITAPKKGNELALGGDAGHLADTVQATYSLLDTEIEMTLRRTITGLHAEIINDPNADHVQIKVNATANTRMILEREA